MTDTVDEDSSLLALTTTLGAHLYMDGFHINTQSWETELKAALNTQGVQLKNQSGSKGTFSGSPTLTASVKASLFCSSWASRSFCWDNKKWVTHRNQTVGGHRIPVISVGLPSTVCILESLRKPGTSPRISQQQSAETQGVKSPNPTRRHKSIYGTTAGVNSPWRWARPRWNDTARLWRNTLWRCISAAGCPSCWLRPTWCIRVAKTTRDTSASLCGWRQDKRDQREQCSPARRSRWPSGTAPTEHSSPPPSEDTCWQSYDTKRYTTQTIRDI